MTGLIVHEWMALSGGSEKVVEAMSQAFPDADLRCLWNDSGFAVPRGSVSESWLARTPLRGRKAFAMPFMSPTWQRMKFAKKYDWVLTSSHAFAHHARIPAQPEVPRYSYIHTPARYIWTPDFDPRGNGFFARATAPYFRNLDKALAASSGVLAANSRFVQDRIREFWNRDAHVLHPPVDVSRIASTRDWTQRLSPADRSVLRQLPKPFIMGASRLVGYKRLDLVIKFAEAAKVPLVIAGSGPEEAKLREMAESSAEPVVFVGAVSDEMLYSLYQSALALIFPAIEDFGIMPVEAMAVGTPVVGPDLGGLAETVRNGVSGWQVSNFLDKDEVQQAMTKVASIPSASCQEHAENFDADVFTQGLKSWMGLNTASNSLDDAVNA